MLYMQQLMTLDCLNQHLGFQPHNFSSQDNGIQDSFSKFSSKISISNNNQTDPTLFVIILVI